MNERERVRKVETRNEREEDGKNGKMGRWEERKGTADKRIKKSGTIDRINPPVVGFINSNIVANALRAGTNPFSGLILVKSVGSAWNISPGHTARSLFAPSTRVTSATFPPASPASPPNPETVERFPQLIGGGGGMESLKTIPRRPSFLHVPCGARGCSSRPVSSGTRFVWRVYAPAYQRRVRKSASPPVGAGAGAASSMGLVLGVVGKEKDERGEELKAPGKLHLGGLGSLA
jgi:hypothetical protein